MKSIRILVESRGRKSKRSCCIRYLCPEREGEYRLFVIPTCVFDDRDLSSYSYLQTERIGAWTSESLCISYQDPACASQEAIASATT